MDSTIEIILEGGLVRGVYVGGETVAHYEVYDLDVLQDLDPEGDELKRVKDRAQETDEVALDLKSYL